MKGSVRILGLILAITPLLWAQDFPIIGGYSLDLSSANRIKGNSPSYASANVDFSGYNEFCIEAWFILYRK